MSLVKRFTMSPLFVLPCLVSNEEFIGFIEAGGYKQNGWWSDEGRSWRDYHHANKPEFWQGEAGAYRLRLMTTEIPLPMNWPVEICYHEAHAFVIGRAPKVEPRWMPDEAEYRRLLESAGLIANIIFNQLIGI